MRTLRREALVSPGARVLVALSGGPDSVALLYVLAELADRGGFALAGVAHLNHQLRGEAADADEGFCRELAARLSLPIEVGRVDVASVAHRDRVSAEVAGRGARYGFLEEAASRLGATRIAIGHTRDDQAETLLLKLLRGAGPRGLAGIHPRRGALIRPLLDVRRREVLRYLDRCGATYRVDATNLDPANPRNRIRHELIPWLERHVSRATVETLARGARIAREDADYLEAVARDAAESILRVSGDSVAIDLTRLRSLAPAVARRVVRHALSRVGHSRFIGFGHVEAVRQMAASSAGTGTLDLPGQQAVRTGDLVTLRPTGQARRGRGPSRGTSFELPLSVPGEVTVEAAGLTIAAFAGEGDLSPEDTSSVHRVRVAAAGLTLPLVVRNRRPGDRFRPAGMTGRKKLQDWFVDRKIPRPQRDLVPLVVDAAGRLVWVVGQGLAADFSVTGREPRVITLTAKQLGGAR